jgi:hypothetical protein
MIAPQGWAGAAAAPIIEISEKISFKKTPQKGLPVKFFSHCGKVKTRDDLLKNS